MSTKEILENIMQLSFNERLLIIEQALKTLHQSSNTKLEEAAETLMSDYKSDKDLTAFTVLDCEIFYETR